MNGTQEDKNPVENYTQDQLLDTIASQRQRLDQQAEMINMLRHEIESLKIDRISQQGPLCTGVVPTTVTQEPHVTFASSHFATISSATAGSAIPSLLDPKYTMTYGVGKKPSKARPLLVTIDDSSDGTVDSESEDYEELTDTRNSDHELRQLADAIGRKGCPKPEIYSLESGRSFHRFMKTFEAYCSSRYSRKEKDLWTSELGRLLEGEARKVFDACGGPDQRYSKMKRSLENWHDDVKERISSSKRSQYRNVKYQDEGFKIFATRLEHLFRAAYPHRPLDGKDLRRTLVGALPRTVSETLERDLSLLKAATGRPNTWEEVLRLLEIQDESSRRSISPGVKRNQPWVSHTPFTAMAVRQASPRPRQYTPVRKTSNHKSRKSGYLVCSWCKKPGHHYDNCRRRLNQCLRCGADNHRIAQCPQTGAIPKTTVRGPASQSHSRASSSSSSPDAGRQRGRSQTPRRHRGKVYTRSPNVSQAPLNPRPLV